MVALRPAGPIVNWSPLVVSCHPGVQETRSGRRRDQVRQVHEQFTKAQLRLEGRIVFHDASAMLDLVTRARVITAKARNAQDTLRAIRVSASRQFAALSAGGLPAAMRTARASSTNTL